VRVYAHVAGTDGGAEIYAPCLVAAKFALRWHSSVALGHYSCSSHRLAEGRALGVVKSRRGLSILIQEVTLRNIDGQYETALRRTGRAVE